MSKNQNSNKYFGIVFIIVSFLNFIGLIYYSKYWPLTGIILVSLLGIFILIGGLLLIKNITDGFTIMMELIILIFPISLIINVNSQNYWFVIIVSLLIIPISLDFYYRLKNRNQKKLINN